MKVIITFLIIVVIAILIAVIWPFSGRNSGQDTLKSGSETLFKSTDGGTTWESFKNFRGEEVSKIVFDKNDSNVILVGTQRFGLWRGIVSEDRWEEFKGTLGAGVKIFDILTPAASTNFITLTFSEKRGHIMRFFNGDIRELLFTPLENFAFFKGLLSNSGYINVIGSEGGYYVSKDGGAHWKNVSLFRDGLILFELNRLNDSEAWAINAKGAFFRSRNGGATWDDFSSGLNKFPKSNEAKLIAFDPRSGALYHGSSFGLLVSYDHGESWQQIKMISAPEAQRVTALAIAPSLSSRIFVGAENQLYYSNDSGESWNIRNIPGSGAISNILINPSDPKVIIIGFEDPSRI